MSKMDSNLILGIHWSGMAYSSGTSAQVSLDDSYAVMNARNAMRQARVAMEYFDAADDPDAVTEIMTWVS